MRHNAYNRSTFNGVLCMQRDLAKMAKAHFDVLVIGGGITGA